MLPSGAEPSCDWLNDTSLCMGKSVLRTDPEGYVCVLVQNLTASPRQIVAAWAIVGMAEELDHLVKLENWFVRLRLRLKWNVWIVVVCRKE